MTTHKTIHDYIPVAKSLTADAFVARYNHPFLFGREVMEEEFRFSTLVTEDSSLDALKPGGPPSLQKLQKIAAASPTSATGSGAGTISDALRIRHWVIVVKKPAAAAGQDRIFVGRSETNDICVPHKTVSKLHGYFHREGPQSSRWQLVDTGSANGTKHNGMRIPPRAKVFLVDGDTICFGRCLFQWMTARSLYDRLLSMPST